MNMKLAVNTFHNLLILLLVTTALTTCTIIDNDLRDLPDDPAYREIVHEEGDGYTVDYKLQPWTIIVKEDFENYVASMDYVNSVLYLYDYIPEDKLPKEGNSLASKISDKLEWGLSYKVKGVRHLGSLYAVDVEPAEVGDIYKHIELTQDLEFKLDDGDLTQVTEENRSRMTRASGDDSEKNFDISSWKIDLFDVIMAIAAKASKTNQSSLIAKALAAKTIARHFTGIEGTVHEAHYSGQKPRTIDEIWRQEKKAGATGTPSDKAKEDPKTLAEEKARLRQESAQRRGDFYNKMKDAISLEVDGLVQSVVTVTPTIRIKNYLYHPEEGDKATSNKKSKYQYEFEISGDIAYDGLIGGVFKCELDLIQLLCDLMDKERVQLVKMGTVYGIPVWFQFKPLLNAYLWLGGDFAFHSSKFFSLGLGVCKNIRGHEDGPYLINNDNELEWHTKREWSEREGNEWSVYLDAGIKFIPHTVFGVGLPSAEVLLALGKDKWNALSSKVDDELKSRFEEAIGSGINITLEIDPSITAKFSGSKEKSGQVKMEFSVPVIWKDAYFMFRPWPSIELSWNAGEAIANVFGSNGTKTLYRRAWYWYPKGTMGATCTNYLGDDYPQFHMEYVIDDIGAFYDDKDPSTPKLKILKENDHGALAPLFQYSFPTLKKKDELKHFEVDLDIPSMEYEKVYIARIEMENKDGGIQYYEDTEFTSVTPSARVSPYNGDVDLLYWEGMYDNTVFHNKPATGQWYETEPMDGSLKEVRFKFYTKVFMQHYELADQLGFYLGNNNKRYVCEGKPKSSWAYCIWDMKVKQSVYKISLKPFVAFKASDGRELENIWIDPYFIEWNYFDLEKCPRDPDWGGNGKPYKRYPETPNSYTTHFSYGNDKTSEFNKDGKMNTMALEKTDDDVHHARKIGEKDGIPVYLFQLDEGEDE